MPVDWITLAVPMLELDTSLSAWLDWIVANYNLLSDTNATLSRDNSNLVILGNNSDDLDISLDLGSIWFNRFVNEKNY